MALHFNYHPRWRSSDNQSEGHQHPCGYEKNIVLDTVYLKFCKYLLSLKTSTPNCMVYGELGTYPVSITIKVRLVSYWLNIISADENKISKQMYNLMYNLHQNDTYQSDWLNCVRNILEVNGFGYNWAGQGLNSNAIIHKRIIETHDAGTVCPGVEQ